MSAISFVGVTLQATVAPLRRSGISFIAYWQILHIAHLDAFGGGMGFVDLFRDNLLRLTDILCRSEYAIWYGL